MKKYNPPIESKETEELIFIANSTTDYWQQDAIDIAKRELVKRGISKLEQEKVIKEWEKEEAKFEEEYRLQLENNKTESYTILEILKVFILAPFYLVGQFSTDYNLVDLWKENYKRKFYQRIFILIAGIAFWITIGTISFNISERKRLQEIENVDISDWEENHYGNDTIN